MSRLIQLLVALLFAAVTSAYSPPVKKDCKDAMGEARCARYREVYKKSGVNLCSTPLKAKCEVMCRQCVPPPECEFSEFGCCWNKRTRARGPNGEGCPYCQDKNHGNCRAQITKFRKYGLTRSQVCAYRYFKSNCPQTCGLCGAASAALSLSRCTASEFGCCWNLKPAKGPNGEGCDECMDTFPHSCRQFSFYCGKDGINFMFMRHHCPLRCGRCKLGQRLLEPGYLDGVKV